jgi:hypothetical protein
MTDPMLTEEMVEAGQSAANNAIAEHEQFCSPEMMRAALSAVLPMIVEACAECQPSTAENPNEDDYQRGRFDGIMEFAAAIRASLREKANG